VDLPPRVLALLRVEYERPAGLPGLLPQVGKIGGVAVRPGAVGPVGGFHLEDAEIDAELNDPPAAGGLHEPGLHHPGLEVPAPQYGVNVLTHGRFARLEVRTSSPPPS